MIRQPSDSTCGVRVYGNSEDPERTGRLTRGRGLEQAEDRVTNKGQQKSSHGSARHRGSRGIRDQPRNPPKYTEKRIRINFPFPCPSVLLTFKIFEACADFLKLDGLGSYRKRRDFGAHRSLVQSCGCGSAALGFPWLLVCDDRSCRGNTTLRAIGFPQIVQHSTLPGR
jgi:hypothetical protein